jgi:hypothetical protein
VAKARKPKQPAKRKRAEKVPAVVAELVERGLTASIRAYAEECGLDRDTLSRRLTESGAKPACKGPRGHPEYRIRDLIAAQFGTVEDPDQLDPFRRQAHYRCELDKLKLQTERGELVPRIECEQEQARGMKLVARVFDTLPDVIERDCGAPPAILARIEKALDAARVELHGMLVEPQETAQEPTAADA